MRKALHVVDDKKERERTRRDPTEKLCNVCFENVFRILCLTAWSCWLTRINTVKGATIFYCACEQDLVYVSFASGEQRKSHGFVLEEDIQGCERSSYLLGRKLDGDIIIVFYTNSGEFY